jgi:hypothetical protein
MFFDSCVDGFVFSLEFLLLLSKSNEGSLSLFHHALVLVLADRLTGFPSGGESYLTGTLAFVFNIHPHVHFGLSAERADFAATITDLLVSTFVFIEDLVVDVVTEILDIDAELLVFPLGLLGTISISLRLPAPITADNLDVGVHLSDFLDIVS